MPQVKYLGFIFRNHRFFLSRKIPIERFENLCDTVVATAANDGDDDDDDDRRSCASAGQSWYNFLQVIFHDRLIANTE